ncbi:GPP34 family phosphoprotein [Propionicicella superfundia]|uniref:GPP34 family phosphoprotein n=1 Tax=Propionicicella superfundia TaxID=348582 RepID=UPI000419ABD1|nr:GPP34 family phosphoprotein [Propionicicella superfundia]
MLVAEDLLLLLTDDDSGKPEVMTSNSGFLLAGALLADLALSGHLRLTERGETTRRNRIVPDPGLEPPADPLLAEALSRAARKSSWRPGALVSALSRLPRLRTRLFERLSRAELVQRDERSFLGFRWSRWPAVADGHEADVRRGLQDVLLLGAAPDDRQAALIGLLAAAGIVPRILLRGIAHDGAGVRRQTKELRTRHWVARATYDAIQEAQAAAAGAATGGS